MKTSSSNWASAGSFSRGPAAALALALALVSAAADEVRLLVKDQKGRPVEGAVVWAAGAGAKPAPVNAEITQKGRQFLPEVTVIPVGSTVRFPNRDDVQHHVYSFSPAKAFDIPLYIGEAPNPVKFETAGVVTLGCNIHDWMAAYIVVLETSAFARTGPDGSVTLRGLPKDTTAITVWHPRLRGKPVTWRPAQGSPEVTLPLRPAFPRTPPDGDGGSYR